MLTHITYLELNLDVAGAQLWLVYTTYQSTNLIQPDLLSPELQKTYSLLLSSIVYIATKVNI